MNIFPPQTSFLENFDSNNRLGFYKETYRMLSSQNREMISEDKWLTISQEMKSKDSTTLINNGQLKLVKEHNQWRLRWK